MRGGGHAHVLRNVVRVAEDHETHEARAIAFAGGRLETSHRLAEDVGLKVKRKSVEFGLNAECVVGDPSE